jgi:hypothetical protein
VWSDHLDDKTRTCTMRSESHYALRLRYVDLVVSIEVVVEVQYPVKCVIV